MWISLIAAIIGDTLSFALACIFKSTMPSKDKSQIPT